MNKAFRNILACGTAAAIIGGVAFGAGGIGKISVTASNAEIAGKVNEIVDAVNSLSAENGSMAARLAALDGSSVATSKVTSATAATSEITTSATSATETSATSKATSATSKATGVTSAKKITSMVIGSATVVGAEVRVKFNDTRTVIDLTRPHNVVFTDERFIVLRNGKEILDTFGKGTNRVFVTYDIDTKGVEKIYLIK